MAEGIRRMTTPLLIALIATLSAVGSAVISGIVSTMLSSCSEKRRIEREIRFVRLHER